MRTKTLYAVCLLLFISMIISSCYSSRKSGCQPERVRRDTKFKGFM